MLVMSPPITTVASGRCTSAPSPFQSLSTLAPVTFMPLSTKPSQPQDVFFHGSFLATGKGHGTDKAVVAGLLGMQVDDPAIPHSFEIAEREGLQFTLSGIDLGDVHPNSVKLELTGESGRTLEVIAASIGGGRIEICEIDGLTANFSGDYPTLIVHNIDQPGHVTEVTSMLAHKSVNIATMQLYRASRGGNAVMVIECDQEIPADALKWLERMEGILKVTYLSLL